jgi:hypothetical protein
MSELDGLKEEIAYLKLWLGIMIVTGISLIAGCWAISFGSLGACFRGISGVVVYWLWMLCAPSAYRVQN